MAAISITAASVLASSGATIQAGIAGATITQGQVVYLSTVTNTFLLTTPATGTGQFVSGIALQSVASGQPLQVAFKDPSFTFGASEPSGSILMASPTAGGITVTPADVASTDCMIVLGVVKGTTGTNGTTCNLNPTLGGVV